VKHIKSQFPWLTFGDDATASAVLKHWAVWMAALEALGLDGQGPNSSSKKQLLAYNQTMKRVRDSALSQEGTGHGRAGTVGLYDHNVLCVSALRRRQFWKYDVTTGNVKNRPIAASPASAKATKQHTCINPPLSTFPIAGASKAWRRTGVSSSHSLSLLKMKEGQMSSKNNAAFAFNPTLFDMTQGVSFNLDGSALAPSQSPVYLDTQGPAGAFGDLEGLEAGSGAFASALDACWLPLFESFSRRLAGGGTKKKTTRTRTNVVMWAADGFQMLHDEAFGTRFHIIDTSNLMDYVHLINLMLCAGKNLLVQESIADARRRGGTVAAPAFIQTEQIIGMASNVENMLVEIMPHDPAKWKRLSLLMGLELDPTFEKSKAALVHSKG
jgi:hypothetical protein